MIRRRYVFHIAGFDPADVDAHYRRFSRQLAIFQKTWNVQATLSAPAGPHARTIRTVQVRGPNWQVESTSEFWPWDDLVRGDAQGSQPVRLIRGLVTFFDLFASGTMVRYLRANVRYALFSLFPLVQVALFAACSWLVARFIASRADLGGAEIVATAAIALVLFFVLLRWPGRRWRVLQALDDWIFARDYVLGRRADLDARLDGFVERLIAQASDPSLDEIVIVGHSLGALFAVEIVARALARDQRFASKGAPVSILTVGATIPKCALHPAAEQIRRNIRRVADEPSIFWAEYQARDDAISFYKFDPAALKKIDGDQLVGQPVIRRLQIHDMLQSATFARHRWRFLRLHYQFVMANDRPSPYDYFMMLCGPVPFRQWTVAPAGILEFVSPDGSARTRLPADQPS